MKQAHCPFSGPALGCITAQGKVAGLRAGPLHVNTYGRTDKTVPGRKNNPATGMTNRCMLLISIMTSKPHGYSYDRNSA